jgi:hypothetical protein
MDRTALSRVEKVHLERTVEAPWARASIISMAMERTTEAAISLVATGTSSG